MTIESKMTIEDYINKASGRFKVVRQDMKPQKETQAASTDFNGILSKFRKPSRQSELKTTKGLTVADYLQRPLVSAYNRPSQQLSADASTMKTSPSNGITAYKEASEVNLPYEASTTQTPISQKPVISENKQNISISGLNDYRKTISPASAKSLLQYKSSSSNQAIEKAVQDASVQYQLSPNLIKGVIKAESNFDANAVSPAGAQGLMQLMPGTAKDMGVKNPFDIKQNIDGGSRYLKKMMDMFGGNVRQALSAYNAGPETVKRYNGNVPYNETRQYVDRVLDHTKTIA
jgi:soluble lytic murein transglycosylase-like protein